MFKITRQATIIVSLIFTLYSCNNPHQPNNAANNHLPAQQILTDSIELERQYPLITDTAQLIKDIKSQFEIDLREAPEQRKGHFTAFKKIRINGSKDSLFLLEYSWDDGSTGSYPWKFQFILSREGKLIGHFSGERYALEKIFHHQLPFLLITQVTGRGNGGHSYYRLTADTLEDVLDGFGDEYEFKTIDGYEDNEVLEPNELPAAYHDVNGDGYNDIVFSGKKLMLGGYTKEGGWYDAIKVNGKTVSFTPEKPASVIPIKFTFLYDPASQHFKWQRPSDRQLQVYLGH